MPADRRKPRPKPLPYNRKPRKQAEKDAPVTAAKIKSKATRENLSLHDWLTVFAYIDKHPSISQGDINPAPQLTAIEKDLMASVEELQKRKRIFGEPPTMEDLIQPPEERDGDVEEIEACDEVEIVAEIKRRISIESGEIIEVESDSDADAEDDPFPDIALADAIAMCEKLEKACITLGYADGDMGLTLPQELRHFRGYLRQRESRNAKQITLTELWRK